MIHDDGLTSTVIAGRYRLIRLLGRGGMGEVYEARHVQTQKRCALKVLRAPHLSGDAESVKRFFREARAAGLIECQNVVSALDSGVDADGRAYYVMEYLAGEDLAQLLLRVRLLTPQAAIKIAAQAARGLASAHALHILHRDIKPANLFLARTSDDQVTVKILDFGVAKVRLDLFEESAGAPTQSGSLLGTLQYMSPAQLKRASEIDETADLWSLGILLYECLAGELPWRSTDGIGELVTAILTRPLPRLQERAPWVPAPLARVVERATSRDERERFSSAREFGDLLEAMISGDTTLSPRELVAPTDSELRVEVHPAMVADTMSVSQYPSSAPFVTSTRPGVRKRAFTYLALGGTLTIAAVSTQLLVHTVNGERRAAEQTNLPAAARAAESPTTSPSASPPPHAPSVAPMSSQANVIPINSAPKPRAPANTAGGRVVGAAFHGQPGRIPSAAGSTTANPPPAPPPSTKTILEQMGGNDSWPNSDNVSPP